MTKIEDYFARFAGGGELQWPSKQDDRDQLASDLLGAEIVGSLDYWVNHAADLLTNATPSAEGRRKNVAWEREMKIRRSLARVPPEAQAAVIRLVAETASGCLFSALVAFDQCPGASIRVTAHDLETDAALGSIVPGDIDLHDRLYEWIEKFSEHPHRYDPSSDAG